MRSNNTHLVIQSPDIVQNKIETMRFFNGYSKNDTKNLFCNTRDILRPEYSFLKGIPTIPIDGTIQPCQVELYDQLMNSNSLYLTGKKYTRYYISIIDISIYGPLVIEIPAGIVNDALSVGQDKERGMASKYLLPHYYIEDKPKENMLIIRGFLVNGTTEDVITGFKTELKIFPFTNVSNIHKDNQKIEY